MIRRTFSVETTVSQPWFLLDDLRNFLLVLDDHDGSEKVAVHVTTNYADHGGMDTHNVELTYTEEVT